MSCTGELTLPVALAARDNAEVTVTSTRIEGGVRVTAREGATLLMSLTVPLDMGFCLPFSSAFIEMIAPVLKLHKSQEAT